MTCTHYLRQFHSQRKARLCSTKYICVNKYALTNALTIGLSLDANDNKNFVHLIEVLFNPGCNTQQGDSQVLHESHICISVEMYRIAFG